MRNNLKGGHAGPISLENAVRGIVEFGRGVQARRETDELHRRAKEIRDEISRLHNELRSIYEQIDHAETRERL